MMLTKVNIDNQSRRVKKYKKEVHFYGNVLRWSISDAK